LKNYFAGSKVKIVNQKFNYERYKEIIDAKNKTWKSEARKLMENGIEFIVVHLSQEDFSAARALRQEFDYVGLHEDKSIDVENPDRNPSKIGFVKRKVKTNPDSNYE
jgi:hypothetical protein